MDCFFLLLLRFSYRQIFLFGSLDNLGLGRFLGFRTVTAR